MTAHIAAGMIGAVVIEPDRLPRVDRSYLLAQSEVYLQNRAVDAASATEVNTELDAGGEPSCVVFNGVANGYDTQPLTARVGERVRFWVLNAGPSHSSSFHIVGTRFDTVLWHRHPQRSQLPAQAWTRRIRRPGRLPSPGPATGTGRIRRTAFPETGRYPAVTHLMADAERGAHGYVLVGQ